jgi:hypothetical protein
MAEPVRSMATTMWLPCSKEPHPDHGAVRRTHLGRWLPDVFLSGARCTGHSLCVACPSRVMGAESQPRRTLACGSRGELTRCHRDCAAPLEPADVGLAELHRGKLVFPPAVDLTWQAIE